MSHFKRQKEVKRGAGKTQRKSGKIAFVLLCLVLSFYFLFFCGCKKEPHTAIELKPYGITDREILIGNSCPLCGHASFIGQQYTHGSLSYINEINAVGGIYGRKIRLLSYDDRYDPPETAINTQRLIKENKVFALFDYVGTPTSVKIIDIINESKIPALGFFTGAEVLRTPFSRYIFHVRGSYYAETEAAVAYFADRLGFKKIAVMYQEDAFGLAVLMGVQLALDRRHMDTAATATYSRGTLDVAKAVQSIRKSGAQAVIMVGTYSPLAKFVKLSYDAGYAPYFHTVSFVGSEAFGKEPVEKQKINPSHFSRVIVTQVVPSPFSRELPAVKEYRRLVTKYYPHDEPNYVALEGFINAMVLVRALREAGKDITREKFIAALETMHSMDYGIGKNLSYNTTDHRGLEGVYYSMLNHDGTFRIMKL